MEKSSKIYVAGHRGMVGSSLVRKLEQEGYTNIVTRTSKDLDLRNQQAVADFFAQEKPNYVFLAAAKVGGIVANTTYPAEFIYENLIIECNVINSSFVNGVKNLLFLGSSCIYPKMAEQPIKEEYLMTGKLEHTNEPYAIAKIAGIKLCESFNRQYGESFGIDYRSLMPTNLYGPGDNYNANNSHVVPALIRKFHEAKVNNTEQVIVWGSGTPKREFLYVDDLADACIFIMNIDKTNYQTLVDPMLSHLNVGYGYDLTIKELSILLKEIVGYEGELLFDHSKPDGTPRKLMNSYKLNKLGWYPKIEIEDGLKRAYNDYLENHL